MNARRIVATRAELSGGATIPTDSHRGMPTVRVDRSCSLVLDWTDEGLEEVSAVRVVVARDFWSTARVALLDQQGVVVATSDVDHADCFEVIDLLFDGPRRLGSLGPLRLVMVSGDASLEVFGPLSDGDDSFAPAACVASRTLDPVESLLRGLDSRRSLQSFGWKLGCVLDGLLDLAEECEMPAMALRAASHLREYIAPDGSLDYHDPWGQRRRDGIYGIEGLLPFAAMARLGDDLHPGSPSFRLFEDFVRRARSESGAIWDNAMLSSEGMYTVAYPLAVVGRSLGDPALMEDAAAQLRVRAEALRRGRSIDLRVYEDGRRTFPDWIRAWTWYLLGLARTLPLLAGIVDVADLAAAFRAAVEEAMAYRDEGGLWRTFIDDAATPFETSGSAGITAAVLIGVRHGLLPPTSALLAERSMEALLAHVRDDGLLGGASQANKDGERLQRSHHRVPSQVGTGLLAQAVAHSTHAGRL